MAQLSGVSPTSSTAHRDDGLDETSEPKHRVFLSHCGAQKPFVEHLCVELERYYRHPFFDKRWESLPIGENFPHRIFTAVQQCHVGVVILSDDFLTSKWPMTELVAMHDRVLEETKSGKSIFKIMPIFLGISIMDLDDPKNWERWLRHWHELARLNPTRVSVEKWEASLKYLRSINGLVYDGLSELRFQKEIVDAICRAVPIEMRLEDSYIEGKSRLCKVIVDKINEDQKSNDSAVCVVGLYGMGGVGKTSICKALCNEFFIKFRGKTSHAELERGSDQELLREVLKNLTDISREHLDGLNGDKLQNELTEGIKDPVFLALDNMADTDASLKEAKSYLSARLPRGSIVIVTARSKELLMRLRSYIHENQCLEMPELLHEEAKSLFIKAADFEVGNEVDEQLMLRCVERCRFSKHDSNASHHYHPLALDVLGRQLGCIDPKEWASQLDMIDDDIFNQLRENDHPIFSILRKSFDTLSPEDQQLFLDVALFIPRNNLHEVECTRFEWLRMVHSIPSIADVVTRLRKLKTKSLLERLEDGSNPRIGMHDLWRAFCEAETNHGGLVRQRWVYESKNRCEIVETSPSGTCWENVNRMAFIDDLEKKLGRVNFSHFPNVTVLKILGTLTSEMLVLDLSGLIHLKSLHVRTSAQGNIVTQGLPRSLVYLHWQVEGMDCDAPQLLEQIAFLEQLECLRFIDYGGFELPDVSSMVSLRWATFRNCENAVTVTGLSSKLTKLQWLNFEGCSELRSCSGVDDLVALKMLDFEGCARLKLPNLRKLRNLRTLRITECLSINDVLGLGDLVALEEFYADSGPDLSELPDMSKLTNLKYLNLSGCYNLGAVPGFDRLISLEELDANFQEVEEWPNLQQLTKLKFIRIFGWNIAGLRGLVNFAMLHTLDMTYCSGVDELPDLRSLISLEHFFISYCEFKSLSGLSNSSMLMTLWIRGCEKLERIPDLRRLTRLDCLSIINCGATLGGWNCAFGQAEEDSWRSDDSNIRSGLPNSQRLTELQQSFSEDCGVVHVTVIGAFLQLERLDCELLPVVELPDLRIFPRLRILRVDNCGSLTKFSSGEITNASLELRLPRPSSLTTLPELGSSSGLSKRDLDAWDGITILKDSGPVLTPLTRIDVNNCNALQVFPDLGIFLALEFLDLQGCGGLTTLGSSMLLPALQLLNLNGCSALESLPDLGMFPALEELLLHGCCRLTTLSSSVPLTALKPLDIGSCSGLESLPDMGMFPSLRRLIIDGLYGLTTLSSSVALPALHCISLPNCSGLKALPDMRMFSALYTLRLDGCRELAKLSASVPLPILHELSLRNCAGLEALPDLGLFPVLEKLVLSGCCGLKTLDSSLPVPALRHLNIDSCSGLEALPDLAYFPALEELSLNGCWELTTLSSSVSLPVLKWLDVRRCWSLSGDDLDQLRGLCPQCKVRYDVIKDYVALEDECVEKHRRSRMLKCFR